ncbi:hypothetical protein BT96DRAFT_763042, partial [Gymnopus androsaceus JB14]
ERIRARWTSPIYSFFKSDVTVGYEKGRKYHYFTCNACHCKGKGGLRRYQDSSDKNSPGNLKKHAVNCFGQDTVDAAIKGSTHLQQDSSIYAAFGRKGAAPVNITHRAHTNAQIRANLVRWITENNCSVNIVEDRKFRELMLAGRPQSVLPSCSTVAQDIQESFQQCDEKVSALLQNYPGRLSFATDAWTSPNHRAMAAWTAHLQHEGKPLVFLLDVFEIPEV